MNLGMIGMSEGNGHPLSFSCILNGYDSQGLSDAGWPVIDDYVKKRPAQDFDFKSMKVTHAWTQDPEVTKKLCRAAKISHAVSRIEDLKNSVDAVILARDDFENHWPMAEGLLKHGLRLLIDKPLAPDLESLKKFTPYLLSHQIFSCSGMRYADGLREPREFFMKNPSAPCFARGTVLNDWKKYGIHVLEAIASTLPEFNPVSVRCASSRSGQFIIETKEQNEIHIFALGKVAKVFQVEFYFEKNRFQIEMNDNFSMFRLMLKDFELFLENKKSPIDPHQTIHLMKTLIAGDRSLHSEGRKVLIHEIQ